MSPTPAANRSCPDENTLAALLLGDLPGSDRPLLDHLDDCGQCRQLVGVLARTRPAGEAQPRPAAATAVAQARLPEPGDRVGRYVIEHRLGEGGMGVVFAARDGELDRRVAIKLIRPDLANADSLQLRLIRESRALARLTHPNVLAVYDVGRFLGHVFIAMEFAGGGSLAQWAQRRHDWRAVVARFSLAAEGLRAAHEAGLVHRDFKADNVLLTADGRVRVADFGLVASAVASARSTDAGDARPTSATGPTAPALTQSGALLGTPQYMAPEQHAGDRAVPASDQFAFCASLYEAIYGEPPFRGATYAELLRQVNSGQVREPETMAQVPLWLRHVLLRGLRVDPDQRWPSMNALIEVIQQGLKSTRDAAAPRRRSLASFLRRLLGRREAPDQAPHVEPELAAALTELRWQIASANALAERGQYAQARELAAEACREAERLGDPAVRAEALHSLALRHLDCGDFAVAERTLFTAAVEAGRASDDGLSARIWGRLLFVIGNLKGRPGDALTLLRPAAEAALARCDGDVRAKAELANSLGTVLLEQGEYDRALEHTTDSLRLIVEAAGPDHPLVAIAESNLGYLLKFMGQYDRALEHLRRSCSICDRLEPGHPRAALPLNNLGELYCEQGDYDQAGAHFERALAIRQQTLPANHPHLALSWHNLGVVALHQRRDGEANELLDRAFAIRTAALGDDHPAVADSLNAQGVLRRVQGDVEAARALHERALAILERALGPDHPRVAACLNQLGDTLCAQGEWEQAHARYTRALTIVESSLGGAHPLAAKSRVGLAQSCVVGRESGPSANAYPG